MFAMYLPGLRINNYRALCSCDNMVVPVVNTLRDSKLGMFITGFGERFIWIFITPPGPVALAARTKRKTKKTKNRNSCKYKAISSSNISNR
jgi:hypothetical protein